MKNTDIELGPFGLVPFASAAKALGLHERTCRRWLKASGSDFPRPSVKIGRRRYYRSLDELRDWLDRQAERARSAA